MLYKGVGKVELVACLPINMSVSGSNLVDGNMKICYSQFVGFHHALSLAWLIQIVDCTTS
jgi:hypothetical protein